MGNVLLATDANWLFDEVAAALAGNGTTVNRVHGGRDVRAAVDELKPELVILDSQIGTMGGIATCLDLRLEEGADRLPRSSVMLLLDRDADVWLARTAKADGWMVKPLDAFRLRRAHKALTNGESWFEGEAEAVPSSP